MVNIHPHPVVNRFKVQIILRAIELLELLISVSIMPIHLNITIVVVIHLQVRDMQTDF